MHVQILFKILHINCKFPNKSTYTKTIFEVIISNDIYITDQRK